MTNVLIAGASIAGPALAFWLEKKGIEVTVVERAPELRSGGYAVDVRGAGLDVLTRMGLRETVRPLQTDTLVTAMVDSRGRTFGHVERGFGVIDEDDVEIHRGDLAHVLYEATRQNVFYRFGDEIAALDQSGPRVVVTFASGAVREYDAVVGADGVHSGTRALAFGPETDFVRPMGMAMAIFTVPNVLGLEREQLLFNTVGRVASVKATNDSRSLTVAVFFDHAGPFDPRDVAGQKQLVRAAFADAGWEFLRLIDGIGDDFYCDVTCQVQMDRYHAGRVALIGDAAYCPSPLSGQGTSLALVGAYTLAAHWDDGFAAYDAAIRDFARQNQAVAHDIAKGFAARSPTQLWLRTTMMRAFPYLPGAGLVMKLMMRSVRKASRAIELAA